MMAVRTIIAPTIELSHAIGELRMVRRPYSFSTIPIVFISIP
jgi:hypothetical protein